MGDRSCISWQTARTPDGEGFRNAALERLHIRKVALPSMHELSAGLLNHLTHTLQKDTTTYHLNSLAYSNHRREVQMIMK